MLKLGDDEEAQLIEKFMDLMRPGIEDALAD
jgi:hypothetical protein